MILTGLVGLAGLASAQNSTSIAVSSSSSATSSSLVSSSASATAITVAQDGSAQFTAIGAAVTAAQNSGIATVSVLAGTYTESVMIPGTQTITLVGPTASSYAQNKVVITASGTAGAIGFGTANSKGATFKYLNFTNTATSGTAPAAYIKGSNIAFYGCSLVSGSTGVFYAGLSSAIIANSYIEGTDKLFTNYPSVYVFNSLIVPTASNALIMYAKGVTANAVNYNSTLVVDSSSVQQKSGSTNTYVYLAAPNGAYTQAIYRNTSLGSFIAPSGFYSTSCTLSAYYGEFETTGAGAYSSQTSANALARDNVCDHQLTAAQMASFSVDQVLGNTYAGYGTFDTTWINSDVLSVITNSDSAQLASTVSSTSSVVSTSSLSSVSSTSASGNATASLTASSTVSSAVSTSASTTCAAPTASGTLVVSLNATSCQYSNISAAISALPADSKPYTILIMPGTYNEQLSITRNGKVTLIGQTTYANDYTKNEVKVNFSSGQLTSAGEDEITPVINAKKTNDNSGLAIYNIDFQNECGYQQILEKAHADCTFTFRPTDFQHCCSRC